METGYRYIKIDSCIECPKCEKLRQSNAGLAWWECKYKKGVQLINVRLQGYFPEWCPFHIDDNRTKMKKYRSKSETIEAMQWNGERPLLYPLTENSSSDDLNLAYIKHKESLVSGGYSVVSKGDYIVSDGEGGFFTSSPHVFESLWEEC